MRVVPGVPEAPTPFHDPAPRHRARRHRSTRAWALVGAAAAALVVVLVGIVVTRDGGDDGETVVASARLEPLPDEPTGSARPVEARVVETADGRRLDLSLPDGLPAPAGFYEVWLIDPDVEGMVSLGPARSDGTYAVPSDLDVTAFPIVDVSVEPPDGNPTHSGVSVLRGTLS
jgi:anti-sigma-K factor RskA